MIKRYTIIGVKCDYCERNYPNNREPIHFADEQSMKDTLEMNGWSVREQHICPTCIDILIENPHFLLVERNHHG